MNAEISKAQRRRGRKVYSLPMKHSHDEAQDMNNGLKE